MRWDLGTHLLMYLGEPQTPGQLLFPLWGRDREGGLDLWTLTHTYSETPQSVMTQGKRGPSAVHTHTMGLEQGRRWPERVRRGLGYSLFPRGLLALQGLFQGLLSDRYIGRIT